MNVSGSQPHRERAQPSDQMSFDGRRDVVLTPYVEGMKVLLQVASETPSVKRFVMTSSTTAINCVTNPGKNKRFDASSWNDESVRLSKELPETNPKAGWHHYGAAKVEAERYAWDFIKQKKVRNVSAFACFQS